MKYLPGRFNDHPDNPLIEPPFLEFIIADPTFLPPSRTPDGKWHLFAHGIVKGIHHFVSDDGITYIRIGRVRHGMRPFLLDHDGVFDLFYERIVSPLRSRIEAISSRDLVNWDRPRTVIAPDLPWEGGRWFRTVGNPSVVRTDDGWALYYSANLSWLKDCGFPEPKFIGLATAPSLEGPWTKRPEPMISPSPDVPHRNLGAGAIKVVRDTDGTYLGWTNGIFIDQDGHSRSDIRLLTSDNGWDWIEAFDHPLIAPEGDGWKNALVYALDVKVVADRWWLYYNARDGWRRGREKIGLATCPVR